MVDFIAIGGTVISVVQGVVQAIIDYKETERRAENDSFIRFFKAQDQFQQLSTDWLKKIKSNFEPSKDDQKVAEKTRDKLADCIPDSELKDYLRLRSWQMRLACSLILHFKPETQSYDNIFTDLAYCLSSNCLLTDLKDFLSKPYKGNLLWSGEHFNSRKTMFDKVKDSIFSNLKDIGEFLCKLDSENLIYSEDEKSWKIMLYEIEDFKKITGQTIFLPNPKKLRPRPSNSAPNSNPNLAQNSNSNSAPELITQKKESNKTDEGEHSKSAPPVSLPLSSNNHDTSKKDIISNGTKQRSSEKNSEEYPLKNESTRKNLIKELYENRWDPGRFAQQFAIVGLINKDQKQELEKKTPKTLAGRLLDFCQLLQRKQRPENPSEIWEKLIDALTELDLYGPVSIINQSKSNPDSKKYQAIANELLKTEMFDPQEYGSYLILKEVLSEDEENWLKKESQEGVEVRLNFFVNTIIHNKNKEDINKFKKCIEENGDDAIADIFEELFQTSRKGLTPPEHL